MSHTSVDRLGSSAHSPDDQDLLLDRLGRRVIRLFTGPWRLSASLSLIALATALLGFGEYQNAITTFPTVTEPGHVILDLGTVPKRVIFAVSIKEEDPSFFRLEITADVPEGSRNYRPCTPTTLRLVDLPMREMYAFNWKAETTVNEYEVDVFTTLTTLTRETCGPTRSIEITGFLRNPIFARSGAALSAQLPGFTVVGQRDNVAAISAVWSISLEHDEATQIKPELVSTGYKGPGLLWRTSAKAVNVAPISAYDNLGESTVSYQYGTFTSMPAQKAAERSLYWAGLLTGAALSFLTWAGEAAWEVLAERRNQKRSSSPEAVEVPGSTQEKRDRAARQTDREKRRKRARLRRMLKRIR
ncbi:hypothetical protein BKM31_19105 [[Actinomadura] parvosata subsp. kistnae]|uniref:Uncharacterized protein n=1 Tax=[Actinomadura] parvosata subsp. kistnae TaxID=1909395 RepID=A0A1U9ZZD7_9ACTN|nr:hypothetical protein [Nonomuraea sp. ATCC 55076]AQZ63290.1 hypothetical protein BKM31_19105 [Nonomuraea sp. ATCC 55076]